MKKFLIFTVLALSLNVFGKDSGWYKCFKGKIGSYPVTAHLNKVGGQVTGYYYYDKYMMPLSIFGSFEGDSLKLIAYSNSYMSESFNGVLKGGGYKGDWFVDGKDEKLTFALEDDTKLSGMFSYEFVTGEKKLMKNYDKSPAASYMEASIWPNENYAAYVFMRRAICGEKDISTRNSELITPMGKNMQNFFQGYMKDYKDVTKDEIGDGWATMYNASEEDIISPFYYDKSVFVTAHYNYTYTGGAHGNYATTYSVYDLAASKKLGLNDVLTTEGKNRMPALLEKNYRQQNNIPDSMKLNEELFVDTIYVTENFAITPGAMLFSYPPYDIASYAAGEIRIYVPINEVEKYLKPAALKLIK